MLELFGFIRSRSNRPHWLLEELEVPYTFYQLDFSKGDNRSPFFLDLNPAGKMPVLRDGDFVLSESGAICTYLAEKFPEKGYIPAGGTQDRARYNQWMQFLTTELEQPLWTAGKHRFGLPEQYRIPEIEEKTAHYEYRKAAKIMSAGLADKEFLLGKLSALDMVLAHTLRWADKFDFPNEHDNLNNFRKRMEERPSYQRMLDTDCKEIPR